MKGYIPGNRYVAVSITGEWCGLNCDFCRGYYLKGMLHVKTPAELFSTARMLRQHGARGLLVSGGFTPDGRLPIRAFVNTIRRIKLELDMVVSVHIGLPREEDVTTLRRAGVDIVDFELPVSDHVVKRLMGLRNATVNDFEKTLGQLYAEGPDYIAPHVITGLPGTSLDDVRETFRKIEEHDPYLTVILVFMPTPGTPLKHMPPPSPSVVFKTFTLARKTLSSEIALGCMRPRVGHGQLEQILLKEGLADRIAMPPRAMHDKLEIIHACCSLPDTLKDLFK